MRMPGAHEPCPVVASHETMISAMSLPTALTGLPGVCSNRGSAKHVAPAALQITKQSAASTTSASSRLASISGQPVREHAGQDLGPRSTGRIEPFVLAAPISFATVWAQQAAPP
jgi:hypothetical protein